MIAAGLGEIAPGGDAELDAEMLEEDRHQVGDHDDGEQGVAKLRAPGEIGGPVAGVHVADGDEETGAGKGGQLAPERGGGRDDDAAVRFGERDEAAAPAPAAGFYRFVSFLGHGTSGSALSELQA